MRSSFSLPKPGNENKVIKYINAYVLYYNQVNYACFDDIMVTVDETGTTYTYDSDGNLISSADNAKRQTTYTIDNATDMVKGVTDSTNTAYTYDYDTTYKKQLKSAKENSTGIGYEYTYGTDNNRGNVEKVQMGTVGSMTSGKYIETNTQYTDNGAYVKVESDQRGYNTTYEVNSTTGEVDYVTDPMNTITDYTYDPTTKQLTNVARGASSVTYGYDSATKGNRLKSITSNGQTYSFTYDKWGNQETVKIGDTRTLSTNSYEEGNGNLIRSTYGNENFVHYSYDSYDRITDKWANEGTDIVPYLKASYTYNKNGQLGKKQEFPYGNTYYNYDISGRLTDYLDVLGKISYGYDNQNRTNKITLTFHNQKFTTTFEYLSANRPGITYLPKGRVEYIYDTLQRESAHVIYPFSGAPMFYRSETEYEDMEGNRTTTQVSGYHNYQGWGATSKMAIAGYSSFNYTYDSRGNIIEIEETNGTQTRTKSYKYDALNQLVRENDEAQGKTFIYSYDNGGNILSKTEYDYTTAEELGTIVNTKTYAYADTEWKDKLTSYNGHAITYDAIGNPLTYYNGMTFNWEQGRRLSGVTLADGGTVDYQYKADGSRYEKTVGTTKTTYFTDDTGIIYAMESGNESLVFMYDATGRREGFVHYTGTTSNRTYYYLYNAQGDVIGLLTDTLSLNVSYEYDTWGKLVAIGGTGAETIGRLNPFRYRGYVYDEETGFYLTGTRYYDPVIGRFINADAAIGQIGNVQGTNMFAYCFNNPVNMSDPTGNWPKLSTVFKVVAVAAAVVAVAAVCVATAGLATVAVAGGGTMLVATATTTTALGVAATAGKVALAATGAAAASEIAEQTYDNLPRNHTVYGLQDPITGKIEYVGRTTDPAKRAAAHKNNTARQHLEMVTLATGLNAIEARGVEQIQMLAHHTINTANKMNNQINGISPFNRKLGVYMEAGRGALSYLENQISNEILYWTGN